MKGVPKGNEKEIVKRKNSSKKKEEIVAAPAAVAHLPLHSVFLLLFFRPRLSLLPSLDVGNALKKVLSLLHLLCYIKITNEDNAAAQLNC